MVVRVARGFVTHEVLWGFVIGAPCTVFGSWLGRKIGKRLDGDRLRKIVYILMAFSGIVLLIRG